MDKLQLITYGTVEALRRGWKLPPPVIGLRGVRHSANGAPRPEAPQSAPAAKKLAIAVTAGEARDRVERSLKRGEKTSKQLRRETQLETADVMLALRQLQNQQTVYKGRSTRESGRTVVVYSLTGARPERLTMQQSREQYKALERLITELETFTSPDIAARLDVATERAAHMINRYCKLGHVIRIGCDRSFKRPAIVYRAAPDRGAAVG